MDLNRATFNKVKCTISRYGMIRCGDRVVVAVSGGPDSVCLLDILYELKHDLGIELIVAHFNHGLRLSEDEYETRFVESLSVSLDLPFETKRADESLCKRGPSLEERARHARYRFLEEVKERSASHKIAVGHNLNDQAETVLMRLLRGSGPSGLAGIPPYRDNTIIRPLIEVTRTEIESYLNRKGLPSVRDPSNFETHCLRNKIRLELLPQLRTFQPRIVELLGQTADIMRRDNGWLESEAKKWLEGNAKIKDSGEIEIPLSSFRELPETLRDRVIRSVMKIAGGGTLRRVSLSHIEATKRVALGKKPQAEVHLPNKLVARRVYDKLIFTSPKESKCQDFCYFLEGPGTFHLKALGATLSLKEMGSVALHRIQTSPWTASLNADHLAYPLMIRNFRPGDKFIPSGMSGHKKLKDFFIDLKIPSEERGRIPILTCQNVPVWVCGLRIDDRFKVTPHTKKGLKVTFDYW